MNKPLTTKDFEKLGLPFEWFLRYALMSVTDQQKVEKYIYSKYEVLKNA